MGREKHTQSQVEGQCLGCKEKQGTSIPGPLLQEVCSHFLLLPHIQHYFTVIN